ncbi:Uncharacterised protein [Bordetella pertussis]|nr:Uncharacterised protein [Bordetella pertussis]
MHQLDHGLALEFAAIGGQPDLARLFDDGARHAHLAKVVVAQGAVGLDAGYADQADVDLELADEVQRGLADDAAVARTHHAAGYDDFAIRVVGQDVGHVQVVGDDAQAAMAQQGARDGLGGRADVDQQRTAVGHRAGHRLGDAALALGVQPLALAVGDVLDGRRLDPHAAMKARQHAGFGKQVDVAPHGLQGDVEMARQRFDGGRALGANQFDQGALSGIEGHVRIIKQQNRKIMTRCKIVFLSLVR